MKNKAMGGTELMSHRIENNCNPSLLRHFQIIHSRVRDLDHSKKKILVLHDLPWDPESQHLKDGGWEKFDLLVFVSYWQQQMYKLVLGVPYTAGIVLRNSIEPIPQHEKPSDKIRLIYYSTPHRGLDILYAVFNSLSKEFDDIELKVYSSFELYGWPENDKPFLELFDKLREHPQIHYSKSVSNDVIRSEIQNSHIFAYPSTWQETSCLCLIEAMSGGLQCVHSSLAALPETSMSLTNMYRYVEDPQVHAQIFHAKLRETILRYKDSSTRQHMMQNSEVIKNISDSIYNQTNRTREWNQVFKSLLT